MMKAYSYSGYITKEGGSFIKNWKKRWAVLNPVAGTLSYFEKKDDTTKPLGIVVVRGAMISAVSKSEKNKSCCFKISDPSSREFYAYLNNEEDLSAWLEALNLVSTSNGKSVKNDERTFNLFAGWIAKLESDKKTWRKKWGILSADELSFYVGKKEKESEFSISLKDCKISFPKKSRYSSSSETPDTSAESDFSAAFLFYLEAINDSGVKTIHYIIARTDDELSMWVEQVDLAIEKCNSHHSHHSHSRGHSHSHSHSETQPPPTSAPSIPSKPPPPVPGTAAELSSPLPPPLDTNAAELSSPPPPPLDTSASSSSYDPTEDEQ